MPSPGGETGRRNGRKGRSGHPFIRANFETCGRGEIGRRNGLRQNLSARRETGDAELLKFGEPFYLAIPSQARLVTAGKV